MKALRLVGNSALLFAAMSGVIYLTGCSSEDGISNGNVAESPIDTDSYSVFGADQSRVHNYGGSFTRSGEYVEAAKSFEMPECPTIPADAKDFNSSDEWGNKPNLNWGTPKEGEYYIKSGDALESGLTLNGNVTIYVAGTLSMNYMNVSGSNTIYVLEGGVLSLPSSLNPGATVYNYGTLKATDEYSGLTIGAGAAIYSAVDITECKKFGVNEGANLYSKGTIDAETVRLNGDAIACAFIANEIEINGNGTIKTSYFETDKLTLHSGTVVLDNNGLVKAKQMNISNGNTRFTVNGTNAVVVADEFKTNNVTWAKETFGENIACKFGKCYIADKEVSFNDLELRYSSEEQVVYVPSAGCHGEYGTKPSDPSTPELSKVTDIEPLTIPASDHGHGVISATCVNFEGNNAYVSYHLRGAEQNGCIEVIKDNGTAGFALGSYMVAPNYDFNHLIVDNGNIVTVGNHIKKGAFIGSLPVSFEVAAGSEQSDFKVKELTTEEVITEKGKTGDDISAGYKNAGDGNCVVRQGDYYYVATTSGYGAVKAVDFSKVLGSFKATVGSSKHLSINGGKTAALSLDSDSETSSTASVKVYDATDYTFATVLNSYNSVGTIAPVDGKNVIAVDGENIYACLSKGGLVRVNDGKKFQRGNAPVNGMAFDDKYVYVANGSFVSVLDKTDLHEVCFYHAASGKSANYIALNNGKIYVAFGEDGLQVYQLTEKTITEE